MKNNKNPYARESTSNGRRSSILKRQESWLTSEGTDGSSDCPRTPRRVSFAKSALVRYVPYLGDESCSTVCSSSDSSNGSSQNMGSDSMFLPDPAPPSQNRGQSELALNTSLTEEFLAASPADQPHVLVKAINTLLTDAEVNPSHSSLGSSVSEKNKTILYTSVNMSTTSDISQISHTVCWQGGNEEINKRYSVRQQEAENHTILFADMDEYGCCMDITSNISMSESLHQQRDESFYQDGFFRKVELQNKPGLNRRPSFADDGTSESRDDQVFMEMGGNSECQSAADCTIIFKKSGEDEMEMTQNLTKSNISVPYPGKSLGENIVLKPKPKLLDDLFQLFKKREPIHVADFTTEETRSLGPEDMEITGEFSSVIARTALSDITTYKGLTPVEEMSLISTNNSLTDQENRLPSNASAVLQTGAHISKLNNVCSKLEQMDAVHYNSMSVKSDIVFEMAIIGPENKENCPIQSSIYKPPTERQTIIVPPNLHTNSVQFGVSSQSSLVNENKSYGNVKITQYQATSSFIEQKGKENYAINNANESSGAHISYSSSERRALSLLNEKSEADTCQNLEAVNREVNFKNEQMLQNQVRKGKATIFSNSHYMELKETDINTTNTEQTHPYSKNCREYYTATFDNGQISECPVSLQEPLSFVCDNSQIGMSKAMYVGNMDNEAVNVSNKIFEEQSTDLNSSQMEMTQGLSKTIFLAGKGSELPSEFTDKINNIFKTREDFNNSQMEMTQGLSKTIFFGGKGSELPSEVTDKSNNIFKTSEDFNNSQMEMTQGLSKTIFLGGKGSELPSEVTDKSNNIFKTREDFNNSQMEMTQGLSKTIFFGGKGSELPSEFIDKSNNIFKTSEDFNNSQMEMTQGLSRTIFLGGNGNEWAVKTTNESNQCFDETNKDSNNSKMAITPCLAKTIYTGDKNKECQSKYINENTHIYTRNKDLNETQMETTHCLSSTIYFGGASNFYQSQAFNESKQVSQGNKDLNNSHMEMTQGLSKTIYFGGKDNDCFHENRQRFEEKNKDLNSSQMEMTQSLSSTIYNIDKSNECQSKAFNESNQICQGSKDPNNSHMEMTQGLSRTIFLEGMDSECRSTVPDSSVIQQSLVYEMEATSNPRSSQSQLGNTPKLTLKIYENNIEPDTEITNIQENAAVQAVDQKRALQQALIKEIGLPLSLSRTSFTFDPFQRRKSCNTDLLFSKRKDGHGRKDQNSNSFVNTNKTMSFVSTPGDSASKCLATLDYTDPNDYKVRAMKHSNVKSTFTYENTSSTSCSEKFDKPGSTDEARLKIENEKSSTGLSVEFFNASAGAKLNPLTSSYADKYSEDLELSEILNNQEMPELTEDTIDFKPVDGYFECKEDASLLSDIESLSKNDKKLINLQDVYEYLGISQLEEAPIKKVPVQNVATTTVKDKLIATVIDVSRLGCLNLHVNEIDATINRSRQYCAERFKQFSNKPPDALVALQTNEYVSRLTTKPLEMIQCCRLSAQAKWKEQKTGHLRKFSYELEAACQALKLKVGNVFSDTDNVLDLITNIDQSLQEVDMICGQKQELATQQKELEETERKTQQLKADYIEMDERLDSLTKINKESAELMLSVEATKTDIEERLWWMSSLVEWTIVTKTDREVHFGFLFNTLILKVDLIDYGSSHQKISRIFLQSRLGDKSKPWAKLAHSLAVSCIDCDKLQNVYKNYDQMHKLLSDVSSAVCYSRQLSTELRLAHLKHGLSIDDNRLKLTVSNRKTRQKIQVDTTISWNPHPQSPVLWNVTTIIGSVLSQDVKSTIDRIEGGPKYITRVLSQIEQLLAQHKDKTNASSR